MAQGPEKALEKPPPPPQSGPSLPLLPPPHPPKEQKKEGESSRIQIMRRKLPMRRSEKEEVQVYGHGFMGCGQQSDYEATTKLGEGTFGEVHKAIHKKTGRAVALKRILMHNEKEGMPVTALREIKILKALKHPCIVDILDMFVVRSTDKDPLSVYMVFPYMDHDLAGLLENERVKLQPSHIKLYMKQLLEGTEYMHRNHILHRDMKAANLLISNNGSLRIADFGLARSFDTSVANARSDGTRTGRDRKYTNCVVTRWYRPPELLLGARHYGGEVDIWGIGCVLGEMFTRKPILPGTSDLDQLEKIWFLCGSPNQHNWPYHDQLPGCEGVIRFKSHTRRLKETYDSVGPETVDLLDQLLIINPKERITAAQALEHDYFWTDPLPADPKSLPSYEASHEFDKRGHRNHHPMPLPAGPPLQVQPVPHAHNQMRGGPPQGNPQFNRGPGGPPNQNQHQRHQYGNGPDMHRRGGPPGGQPGNYPAPNHPRPHNMGMNGPGPGRPPAVMGFGNGPGQGGPPPMGMPSMAGMPGMPPQFPPHPLPYGRSGDPPPGAVYGGVPPQPPLAVQFPLNPPRPPFPSHHQGNRPPMRNDRQRESRNNDPPPPPRTSSLPTNPNLPPRPAAPLGSGARDGERDRERDRVYRGAGRNDPPGPGEPPVGALNYG
ncbi:hypothetical protein NLJ89_g5613 [Agrocybe chaxingu]|uniref:Protein kinase domain-containing protein n=1 Tax=Agrocybe chaxingu TaxID=84603 RepID=A0A9W8K0X0_9AGAR|nr:hypothetical protein NLJ89_g5613 [Agrocybe chaxingu]